MFSARSVKMIVKGCEDMTKEQYLRARIADIETLLRAKRLPPKYRRNQMHALMLYKMDLEREQSISTLP